MAILLEQYKTPAKGLFEIDIQRSLVIQVTAEEAQRKVSFWLLDQVSYMMHAELPTLVIGEQVVWRVPSVLTASHVGRVGEVGTVDVDVQTGAMNNLPACKDAIMQRARELVKTLPPYQPRRTVSDQYIPKHIPRAPLIKLPDEE